MALPKKPALSATKAATKLNSQTARQKNVLAVRGTEQWKEWLDGFAASKGMPVTVLVDHALRELAKREGYPAPPTRV